MQLFKVLFFVLSVHVYFFATAGKCDKELQPIDRTYEPNIKTVLLYPNNDSLTDAIQPAIMSNKDSRQFLLSFDEITSKADNYYVRIVNCNADWTFSNLNSIMFLDDYNEFRIMDQHVSFSTRITYIHYKFPVPRLKISGNFIVVVYREGDVDDVILSKRFMIYEPYMNIVPQIKFPITVSERNTGQQTDFILNYGAYNIINPRERLKVVIRQNYNWNNTITGLNPNIMRDDIKSFEYSFYNNENVFKGYNEFRFFDLRSLKSNGMNVGLIQLSPNKNEALLVYDKSRKGQAYGTYGDLNGMYAPEQYETKGFEIEPDYVYVSFTLDTKLEDPGRIFITGALSNWKLDEAFEMKYDPEEKMYTCEVLLKQGYYNYRYTFLPKNSSVPDEAYLEGSSSIAENMYDFIVYYRQPGGMYDQIIGYKNMDYLGTN